MLSNSSDDRVMEVDRDHQDTPGGSEVSVILRGGGNLVSCRPVFTPDCRYLLYASGHCVKVSSIAGSECVKVLKGHTAAITAIVINPSNQFQALTCARDSSIIKWDIQDGMLLTRYRLDLPLVAIYPSKLSDQLSTFYAVQALDDQHSTLVRFDLPRQALDVIHTETIVRDVQSTLNMNDVGCQGLYLACAKIRTLRIYDTRKNYITELRWDGKHKITCVACHSTEFCIATGISDGRIVLWRNFLDVKDENLKVIKTVLQWHALPVRDLLFTVEGSCLLSVGYECVLVKWHIQSSNHRDTLPRLGAPICYISSSHDNQLYATCHSDNGIQVISNNFKIIQLYQGFVQGYRGQQVKTSKSGIGLLLDRRNGALVANGRPGQLQFYHPVRDEQLFCLDITGQNYVSSDDLKRPLVMTEVERAALNQLSDWLITYERRSDEQVTDEMRLKFWSYNVSDKTFVLNTTVNVPHSRKVETIQFRPAVTSSKALCVIGQASDDDDDDEGDGLMVVTTSCDGTFKLWRLVDDTDIYRTNVRWTCQSVGSYHNLPAGPACFSEDGSLLAVGFSDALTLWNPTSNSLRYALSLGGCEKFYIRDLVFGLKRCSHILFVTTSEKLYAWNIISWSLQYIVGLEVHRILPIPETSNICMFTAQNSLLVIEGLSGANVYRRDNISSDAIVSAIFVPSTEHLVEGELKWMKGHGLYMMTSAHELLTIENTENDTATSGEQYARLEQHLPMTRLNALLGHKRALDTSFHTKEERWVDRTNSQDRQLYSELICTPVHVLPPVSSISLKFIESLMQPHKQSSCNKSKESDSDDDDDDDDDDYHRHHHISKNSDSE